MTGDNFYQIFPPNALIFREGEPGDTAYIIEKGSLEIIVLMGNRELQIARLGPGDIFGEMALVDNQMRTAGARTLSEVSVIAIGKDYVREKLEKSDPVIALFMKAILGRFRKMHASLKETAHGASVEDAIHTGDLVELEDYGLESAFTAGHLALTHELENALREKQLHLYYQAVVNLATHEIKGFEALIRQIHPTKGLIPPVNFIGMAEESGLIVPIGYMIVTEVCELMKKMERAQININLSARQFEEVDLIQRIGAILAEHCPDPRRVTFEITESILMSDPNRVDHMLSELKALGVKIAIDDFGTGYSSFSYLHRFPIDILKIDGSFIKTMASNPKSLEIVRALIGLASSLQMEVVAEGVETLDQVERLREMGCDFAQGYYYSKPIPITDTIDFFNRGVPSPEA
ncbi:MAG: EAL domain-containing protein [Gammaproteobacteria bacterium]|nr:EAL domain-containing protein [Gammaproteobacteria bacterium]MBU1653925.1 EAL domain-containing protein [Gammaproteobacteria bacterium]MBU1960922.1 EAL domain-containing protein [Gammaproteobacteria bacterium]